MSISQYSLISLKDVKSYYNIQGANSEIDDLLASIIDSVSVLFESYCNKNFIAREYTEQYDGRGLDTLFVKQYPIVSVDSIYEDTEWVFAEDTLIEDTNYYVDSNCVRFKNMVLGDSIKNIKITYTAGFSTVPKDIQHCCILEVIRRYKRKNDPDILSKTADDGSIIFKDEALSKETKIVLNKYKRLGVA